MSTLPTVPRYQQRARFKPVSVRFLLRIAAAAFILPNAVRNKGDFLMRRLMVVVMVLWFGDDVFYQGHFLQLRNWNVWKFRDFIHLRSRSHQPSG